MKSALFSVLQRRTLFIFSDRALSGEILRTPSAFPPFLVFFNITAVTCREPINILCLRNSFSPTVLSVFVTLPAIPGSLTQISGVGCEAQLPFKTFGGGVSLSQSLSPTIRAQSEEEEGNNRRAGGWVGFLTDLIPLSAGRLTVGIPVSPGDKGSSLLLLLFLLLILLLLINAPLSI